MDDKILEGRYIFSPRWSIFFESEKKSSAIHRRRFINVSLLAIASSALSGVVVADATGEQHRRAIDFAGDHGLSDPKNIGIILYYGQGNGSSEEDVGNYIVGKLEERMKARLQVNNSLVINSVNAEFFIEELDRVGIAVGFLMGGLSVGPVDIRDALTSQVLDEVIDVRNNTARLLYSGSNGSD